LGLEAFHVDERFCEIGGKLETSYKTASGNLIPSLLLSPLACFTLLTYISIMTDGFVHHYAHQYAKPQESGSFDKPRSSTGDCSTTQDHPTENASTQSCASLDAQL
jgi:hypothetical protein